MSSETRGLPSAFLGSGGWTLTKGFQNGSGLGLASVALPAFTFSVRKAVAAWVLLLLPRGLCVQPVLPVGDVCPVLPEKGHAALRHRR